MSRRRWKACNRSWRGKTGPFLMHVGACCLATSNNERCRSLSRTKLLIKIHSTAGRFSLLKPTQTHTRENPRWLVEERARAREQRSDVEIKFSLSVSQQGTSPSSFTHSIAVLGVFYFLFGVLLQSRTVGQRGDGKKNGARALTHFPRPLSAISVP